LRDGEVINRLSNRIGFCGGGKIESHFDGQQQSLRAGAFFVRHAYAIKDFKVCDGYFHPDEGFLAQARRERRARLSMNRTFLFERFSLTPALSRWEREDRRPIVGKDE
jgi:hypothetical protein